MLYQVHGTPVARLLASAVSSRFLATSCTKTVPTLFLKNAADATCARNSRLAYTKTSALRMSVAPALALPLLGGAAAVAALALGTEDDRLEGWNDRWKKGNIAWHRGQPNDVLVKHYDRFLGVLREGKTKLPTSEGPERSHRVLVPLCGKTLDMPFLADKGHEVVGVDGVETSAWQLQRDAWLKFEVSQQLPQRDDSSGARAAFIPSQTFDKKMVGYVFKTDAQGTGYYLDSKPFKWFRDTQKRLSVVIQDFLHLSPRDIGTFDSIWDRGALVALRPEDREAYVALCDRLLEPGGRILLATYDYDQSKMQGPPHSIPLAEVRKLYGKKHGYKIELISSDDVRQEYKGPKWEKLGTGGLHELAILITKPAVSVPGWLARVLLRRKAW